MSDETNLCLIQLILSLLATLPEYESKIHLVSILKISQFFNLKRLAYFCIREHFNSINDVHDLGGQLRYLALQTAP